MRAFLSVPDNLGVVCGGGGDVEYPTVMVFSVGETITSFSADASVPVGMMVVMSTSIGSSVGSTSGSIGGAQQTAPTNRMA